MAGNYERGLETKLKILREFALDKEIYQYDLRKKVEVSYRTILRALHSLRKLDLLEIIRKEPSEKRGKEKNVWVATLRGLLELFANDEEIWKEIDLIAEVHREKLLIFKKWKFFEKEKLKPLVIKSLQEALREITTTQLMLLEYFGKKVAWTIEDLQKVVDSMALGCYDLRGVEPRGILSDSFNLKPRLQYIQTTDSFKILKACKKDGELKNFVESELNSFKKAYEENFTFLLEGEKLWVSS